MALPTWQAGRLKLALVSISIANLCFLLTWKQVLGLVEDPAVRFFEDAAPQISLLLALIADVGILALFVFAAGLLRGASSKTVRSLGTATFVTLLVLAFYQLERFLTQVLTDWKPDQSFKLLKIAAACILLVFILRFTRRALQSAITVLLIVSPVFLMLGLNGLWQYKTVDLHSAKDQPPAPVLPGTRDRPHLIWITFDELDNRMLFDARPQRIQLPEFDGLRSTAIYGSHTLPPAAETLFSMPSFILGTKVSNVKLSTSHLSVQLAKNSPLVDFGSQPNVFRSARAAGLNAGLTGWYVSYCRFLGSDTSDCTWDSLGPIVVSVERHLRSQSLLAKALYLMNWQARWSVPAIVEPWHLVDEFPDGVRIWREDDIRAMKLIAGNAFRMLQNPNLNLVFIHIPVPHPPGIWDTQAKNFALENSDYVDNLALADAALGRIRTAMERSGAWDSSTLLISGDHPYRPSLWQSRRQLKGEMANITHSQKYPYVPFFLKLPGQRSGIEYSAEFDNVLSADLALQILKGQLKTPSDAIAWLEAHAANRLK